MQLTRLKHTILTYLVLLLVSLATVVGLAGITPDSESMVEARQGTIPISLFGLHIHHLVKQPRHVPVKTQWPTVPFDSWRLWDAYVTWANLEPEPGKWEFDTLDQYVELAQKNQVEVVLLLGLSPQWASSQPDKPSAYGRGNAAPPKNIEDWRNYVRTVATRYKGKIHYYELWNEPNGFKRFYHGTLAEMLELCREAYQILKEIDPTITVVSPSATGDWGSSPGVDWLDEFLSRGGGDYADIIGYHFYVMPGPPENMIPLIQKVQAVMAKHGQEDKPLWNTECTWLGDRRFSAEESAAYVARSYIINWAMGIQRVYWYAWDSGENVRIHLTRSDQRSLTPAGKAYSEIQKWLVEASMRDCQSNRDETWICPIESDRSQRAWIVWNPDRQLDFRLPEEWGVQQMRNLAGDRQLLSSNRVEIGPSPLLLEQRNR